MFVFGEYKGKDFYIERVCEEWKSSAEEPDIYSTDYPRSYYSKNEVIGKLYEKYGADIDIYRPRLSEARSKTQLKELLTSQLGGLSTNVHVNIKDLFDSAGNLEKAAADKLKAITSSKAREPRILETIYLYNAWKAVTGTSKYRSLKEFVAAYLFLYTRDGRIIEGTPSGLQEWTVDTKVTNSKDIRNRFKKAISKIEADSIVGEVNSLILEDGGEACLITLAKNDNSVSVLEKLQANFRKIFSQETPQTAKVSVASKASSLLQGIFGNKSNKDSKDVEVKKINSDQLKNILFKMPTKIKMSYTQEEVDLARDILNAFKTDSKKSSKAKASNSGTSTSKKSTKDSGEAASSADDATDSAIDNSTDSATDSAVEEFQITDEIKQKIQNAIDAKGENEYKKAILELSKSINQYRKTK